jgi:hypothetical protein
MGMHKETDAFIAHVVEHHRDVLKPFLRVSDD